MSINKVIISGGGTGGHIFPAIAIADELKRRNPAIDILFVGAEGKMEMEKVPQAGYKIIGLTIVGFQRKLSFSNFLLPFKIIKSVLRARNIIKEFQPDVVIGVGGYASGPTLKAAGMIGVPTLIQEQNSFAGKTNKILGKSAKKICVAYENMDCFFPKQKITMTGNPVRSEMVKIDGKREKAIKSFNLDPTKKTILVIGGSLGAKTLNDSIKQHLDTIIDSDTQVIWQCGKYYFDALQSELQARNMTGIHLTQFISKMDYAYAASDIIISRAGAISVSELCLVKKPMILVPSPNVTEDHQTHNAMALVNKVAALIVKDSEARDVLVSTALKLMTDEPLKNELSINCGTLAMPNATITIVDEIEKCTK